ncbi:EAL domain-containing protein [Aliagarivorans marinus]|uniref:EAL domain-containing protein n=1 Tax=Aliagarivorans marinus TaxID=561965 RepID=UPI000A074C24|nr:EAL domain-containing protein [Aliagarivorans marinus]
MSWMVDGMQESLFNFAPEAALEESFQASRAWKVLSIEDNISYQDTLVHSLSDLSVSDLPIQFLRANSSKSAIEILTEEHDISVILLDVVMEQDDAGLRLVDTIRDVMGNNEVRIILLTGQPGMAPLVDVMQRYDIDEYWNKADLEVDKLRTTVASHIRTWHAYHELERARHGLNLLVDASRHLSRLSELKEFSKQLLEEIAALIGVSKGGIICARNTSGADGMDYHLIACSGSFSELQPARGIKQIKQLPEAVSERIWPSMQRAIELQTHQFEDNLTVLYFDADIAELSSFVVIVESNENLTDYHINLLQAFSENINNGFNNILLCDRLTELAYYDADLKIPNRAWLTRFLDNLHQRDQQAAVIYAVRLKNFTELQLSADSDFIDEFLKQFFLKLRVRFALYKVIARISDDCFAIVLNREDMPRPELQRNINTFRVMTEDIQLHVETQVALLQLSKVEETEGRELIRMLESALIFSDKEQQQYVEYKPQFREEISHRHRLLQKLNGALGTDQLFLVFQPKLSLEDDSVVGFEALLRWHLPDGSFVSPGEFVPVAESYGLINQLDYEVLKMTLEAIKVMRANDVYLPVSFNVTCADLLDSRFMTRLLEALDNQEVPAAMLEVELTESQAMEDYKLVNSELQKLIELGVGVNIDDFGTGYSSLQHVTNLAATHLKIDRAFVDAMSEDSSGEHVVDMVLKLGERFNFKVVAEGIETVEQCNQLQVKGCAIGQGYLFAKPMPLSDLFTWLSDRN